MAPIDPHIRSIAYENLGFKTLNSKWTQLWNNGSFGTQTFTFTISPDVRLYLVEDGGQYAYMLVTEVNGYSTPGPHARWDEHGRVGFQYQFDIDIRLLGPDGKPLTGGTSATPRATTPETVNQENQTTSTVSSSHSASWNVMTRTGATGEGGTALVGGSYGETTSKTVTSGKSTTITDWGVRQRTNPSAGLAAWTWHQQTPYDAYVLNQQGSFGDWWEQAFHHSNEHVNDLPELSKATLEVNAVAIWRIDHALVHEGSLPVRLSISANCHVAAVTDPNFYVQSKSDRTGHHKIWYGERSVQDSMSLDLAKEVGWWIPAAYDYGPPTTAPRFVGLGNWGHTLAEYPDSAWKAGYQVRYAVSFFNGSAETHRGPWTDYVNHGSYIMPQLTDIPIDPSGFATERRLYRQFEGQEPTRVRTIPGFGAVEPFYEDNRG